MSTRIISSTNFHHYSTNWVKILKHLNSVIFLVKNVQIKSEEFYILLTSMDLGTGVTFFSLSH